MISAPASFRANFDKYPVDTLLLQHKRFLSKSTENLLQVFLICLFNDTINLSICNHFIIMRSTVDAEQEGAARPPQDRNLSKRILKFQKWDSYRDEIYRIYVLQNHTLRATMQIIKEEHNFAPR
jgi:hypothetical protein